jgi:hypothetical protein
MFGVGQGGLCCGICGRVRVNVWCWAGCVKGKEFERVHQQGSERCCFCVWWIVMVGFVVLKR